MSAKQIINDKILDIINEDFKTSDDEIELYIKKNKKVINHCINDYIEEFGNEVDESTNINEDWIREYLGEYCVN